jgi:hypothetical protein
MTRRFVHNDADDERRRQLDPQQENQAEPAPLAKRRRSWVIR